MIFEIILLSTIIQCVLSLNSILLRNELRRSNSKEYKKDLIIEIYDKISQDMVNQRGKIWLFYAIFGSLLMVAAIILRISEVEPV